jgi:L-2,4-diaminobutyrate transaminase
VANLKLIDDLDLVSNASSVGNHLNTAMVQALGDHANVGDIRGEGMLCAVELVKDRDDRVFFDVGDKVGPRVVAAMLDRGVIARAMPQSDIIGFAPPFSLTKEQADEVVAATKAAVAEVLG